MSTKRDTNIEMMRIIAMLMITFNHIMSLSGIKIIDLAPKSLLTLFWGLGGKVGSNLFFLVTAYFLAQKSSFRLNRIIKIWLTTLFYLLFLNIVDILVFNRSISASLWVKSFFPVIGGKYWYPQAYISFLFAAPVISSFLMRFKFRKIFLLIWTIPYIIYTVTLGGYFPDCALLRKFFYIFRSGPFAFFYLFSILFSIEKFGKKTLLHLNKKYCFLLAFFSYFLMYGIEILLFYIGSQNQNQVLLDHYTEVRGQGSILTVICSLCMFAWFLNLKIHYNKIINFISALTFGVYLLQCHCNIIWKKVFPFNEAFMNFDFTKYIIYCCLSVFLIFIAGLLVELLRRKVFTNLEERIINSKITLGVECRLQSLYSFLDKIKEL